MKKSKIQKWLLAMSAFAVMLVCAATVYSIVHAESISVTEIDYEKLTLTVTANAGDSRIFLATSKNATTWDEIPEELDENHKVTMDISWASLTKNYTLYLKGDKSTDPVQVVLPKQNTKFKASLNIASNELSFTNVGTSGEIYWRKSTSTEWKKFNQAEMKNLLESFSLKGISLVFRTGQVKGTSVANPGERPSKVSTVKVAKRAAAPKVSLNYNTMTFGVKKTMEYKLSDEDEWKPITVTTLNLGDVMPKVMYGETGVALKEDETVGIDFRVKATTSKVASQTTTLEIPGQEDTPTANINHVYTGPTQLKLLIDKMETENHGTLEEASTSNPYEYTVVKAGEQINIYTAKWTSITTNTTKISSTAAPEGSAVYVRKKAGTAKLPGKEQKIIESVQYVDASSLQNKEYNLEKIQGVKNEMSFVIGVSSKEADVSSITFNGTKAGFKALKSDEPTDGKYLITVTINDTSAIENVSENLGKLMTAEITLSNTEVITKGVTLYIQKAATLEAKSYTTYANYGFIGGNAENGDLTFDIALNKEKGKESKVASISYNGKVIDDTKYFAPEPDADKHIAVTIPKESVSELGRTGAGYVTPNKYGIAYSLVVTLENGEKLDNIKLTVDYPVKVSSSNSSFGISVSSYEAFLKELEYANKVNSDSDPDNDVTVPTTYSNPEVTYTIQKDIYNLDSTYALTSLTWNGKNVLASVSGASGEFKVKVDLKKLTAPKTGSNTVETGSASLVMTLTNSAGETLVVNYGYQITLTD